MEEHIFQVVVTNPSDFARPVRVELSKLTNMEIERMFTDTLVWATVELEIKLEGRKVGVQSVDPLRLLHMNTTISCPVVERPILHRVPYSDLIKCRSHSELESKVIQKTIDMQTKTEETGHNHNKPDLKRQNGRPPCWVRPSPFKAR